MKQKTLLMLVLLGLQAWLPMTAWAQFDQYFTESSLRVDYVLTGNNKTTTFSLKELIHEPYWSGSKGTHTRTLLERIEDQPHRRSGVWQLHRQGV